MTELTLWPDQFDFRRDETCQNHFKPFIQNELRLLKEYDGLRPADTNYIFHQHAPRVAVNVKKTCLSLGLGDVVAENMYWAALPHDLGKRKLPVHLWDMKDKPEDDIKALRRTHTDVGTKMIADAFQDIEHPFKDLLLDIVANHHEQMDGGGFRGLSADEISMPVRLVAVVEAYDGYSIHRPHFGDRDISPKGVIKRMKEEKAAHYDPDMLEAFASVVLEEK